MSMLAAKYNPNSRSFLATVSLLGEKEKIDSVEDKYLFEILDQWHQAGAIDPATLPGAAKAVFGPLMSAELADGEAFSVYRKALWSSYAQAAGELERHIAARGRVLLSIDATAGDTMFFALVSPEIARHWRDKALSEQDGYRAGVHSPMWDRFWDHLVYAMRLDGYDAKGYPPGTRLRDEAIPFADFKKDRP
jgi:hypothetical protein